MDSDHKLLSHFRPHYPNSNLSQPWFYGKSRNILDDYSGIPEAQTNVSCINLITLKSFFYNGNLFQSLQKRLNVYDRGGKAIRRCAINRVNGISREQREHLITLSEFAV